MRFGRFVDAEHEHHAADEMHEKIAGDAGAVFLPAAPAREIFRRHVGIPGFLRRGALPGVPIEICGREIGWRRILPRAVGIVAAVGAFDEREFADRSLGDQFFGLGADHRADALRSDLHDFAGFFERCHHFDAVLRGVRHRLFAVDRFSGADGIDDDLFVPVIGNRGEDAVDVLVVEEIFVAARDHQVGLAGDFAGQQVAAVVQIGRGDAFDAGQREGIGEDAGAFHADADDAEAQAVAGRNGGVRGGFKTRVVKEDGVRGGECAGAQRCDGEIGGALDLFSLVVSWDWTSKLETYKVDAASQRQFLHG